MRRYRKAKGGETRKIDGFVYCLTHGEVHEDSTDPYGYGEADCQAADHRQVRVRLRKGDYLWDGFL